MKTVKAACVRSLPVMAGYIILGIDFGILAHKAGYGLPWALAMSLFIFAGSMQYVGVGLLAGGVVSGTALIRPDFPELKQWPFLWQQTEYVLGGGSSRFMFLVLAVRELVRG